MILVTGGTGFLGTHLLNALVEKGEPIRAIMRNPDRIPAHLKNKVEWIQGDILDVIAMEEAMEGIDKVYHCAAIVSFDAKDHKAMQHVNATGTANVVNAALYKGVKKLVHVSSVAALGRSGKEGVITEKNKWEDSNRNSVYALSKYLAEREVWRAIQEGLNAVIVNPTMIFGPCDWKLGTGRFFLTSKNGISFYPNGANGFVYVNDVVNCMMNLMESNITGERFIINSENYSYKDFITEITKQLGVKQPTIKAQPWMTEIIWRGSSVLNALFGIYPLLTKETARNANYAYTYTNKKIIEATGYSFTPVKEAVKITVEKFKEDFGLKGNNFF